MRKNNLMVILLLITMVVTVVLNVSYADYEEDYIYPKCPSGLYVDPEYTTIYENDTINVNLGCDGDCNFKIGESKTVEPGFHKLVFAEPIKITGNKFSVVISAIGNNTYTYYGFCSFKNRTNSRIL